MRPLSSYFAQGQSAANEVACESENPHPAGTIANLQWNAGFITNVLGNDDLDQDVRLDIEKRLLKLSSLTAEKITTLNSDLPDLSAVASSINLPLDQWFRVHLEIPVMALQSGIYDEFQKIHGKLFPVSGMYVSEDEQKSDQLIRHHSWLESADGFVIDHTSWIFSGLGPITSAVLIDNYDLASMRINSSDRPEFPPAADDNLISIMPLDCDEMEALDHLLGENSDLYESDSISESQLYWILTSPLDVLGRKCQMIFDIGKKLGMSGVIPIDTRKWAYFANNNYRSNSLEKFYDLATGSANERRRA